MAVFENNCVYSFALALILLGSVLFAVFCSELIPDYSYTQELTDGSCSVVNSSIIANVCCQATVTTMSSCSSTYIYPCAVVTATVNTGSTQQEVTLFNDFKSATRSGVIAYCSLFHCDGSTYEDRLASVNQFLSDYGTSGSTHTCYYGNKEGAGWVGLVDRVSSGQLIPAILVPVLLMVVGGMIVVIQCILDRKKTKRDAESIPPSAENLKKADHLDEDSDVETIEMNTAASTLTTNLSGKGSVGSTPKLGSPVRHPHTPAPTEEEV